MYKIRWSNAKENEMTQQPESKVQHHSLPKSMSRTVQRSGRGLVPKSLNRFCYTNAHFFSSILDTFPLSGRKQIIEEKF